MTEFEEIKLDVDDAVATITLNRPEKLNAFTITMMREMIAAFDITDADDDVRAVIVTGAGRAFCAGADVSSGGSSFDHRPADKRDAATSTPQAVQAAQDVQRDGGGLLTLRIFKSVKPVIAAINGPAVGIGATMTLPMDIRIASTEAKIGFVFSRRGLVPEAASSWFLPRAVGISTALEWTYSGRVFPASEANEAGLVRSLHEPQQLLEDAHALARCFADSTSPVSVAATRQLMWRMLGADHPMEAHKIDSRLIQELGQGPDVVEGVMSFLEKREPDFPGQPSTDMPPSYPWWTEPEFE